MGKSYRHAPWVPSARHRSYNHSWQRKERRRWRHACKRSIAAGKEPPSYKLYCNEWASPRDGKLWAGFSPFINYLWDAVSWNKKAKRK